MKHLLLPIITVFLFIAGMGELSAQKLTGQARIDSFLKELPSAKEDTNKVKLLDDLSYAYNGIDPALGLKYAQDALSLAQTLQYKRGIALAYGNIGVNNMALSDYPKALDNLLTALKIYEELHDKRRIASTLGNIGNIYIHQGDYPKTLEYYFKVLKMFEDMNSQSDVAITYANIASVYENESELSKALEYCYKALKICTDSGYKRGIAINQKTIGNVYEGQGNYAKALEYDFTALKTFEELGDKHSIAICLGSIGECYMTMTKDTVVVKPDKLIPATKAERLKLSVEYLKKAITLFTELGDLDDLQIFSQNLSEAQVLSGNYKDALESYKEYVAINDSVFGKENQIKLLNLQTKREIDLKNKQIEIDKLAVEKKKSERIFYIIGILLLLAVIGFMMRNYFLQRKSNHQLSLEKKRSEDLLRNILPAEVANELKEKGTSTAKQFSNVTVMFTDFVDFTRAGERMTPQQLVDELHNCFKVFDGIMRKYNIEKIKTIGDAYMAVAGLPVPNPDHAANVINAAFEIRDFMAERKQQMGDNTFEVRIGVHSGDVVAGIVGLIKFAYDIWGDAVNTAARMEEHSEAGKINISQITYDLVKDKFKCRYRGEVEAKNKGKMSMYFVEEKI